MTNIYNLHTELTTVFCYKVTVFNWPGRKKGTLRLKNMHQT